MKNFKNFPTNISRTPMSIQNFPRIPKIILKKSAEQVKDTKNEKASFFCTNVSDSITRLAKPLYSHVAYLPLTLA